VFANGTEVHRLVSPPVSHEGGELLLNPDSFPLRFVPVAASASLLNLASLKLVCTRDENGQSVSTTFVLDAAHMAAAVALPLGSTEGTMSIQALPQDGNPLTLGPLPLRGTLLDLSSFPQYGSQTVQLNCSFEANVSLYAIELAPETAAAGTVLHFTPDLSARTWVYLAASPFRPGFRYREYRSAGETPAAWSAVLPPNDPLQLRASGPTTGAIP
jgi:hypothetical protein